MDAYFPVVIILTSHIYEDGSDFQKRITEKFSEIRDNGGQITKVDISCSTTWSGRPIFHCIILSEH